MAVDMFLELDGIKGESTDDKQKDKIDVLAWSWGVSNAGSFHQGGGGGSGKASFNDLSVTKYVDKATADLLSHCATGKHIKSAKLIVRKSGGSPIEYLVVKLTDLIVSGVSTGGSGGETRLTENITLNFAKVELEYKTQDAKGAPQAGGTFTYDIQKNKA